MLSALALGLVLGQATPLRLVPPALLSDAPLPGTRLGGSYAPPLGLEPGTRLLPFNEAEPSRGPLAPPPPLGPPPLSTDEWRAVLLARAKKRAEAATFGPGPKDPWKAVSLSAEGILIGIVFPPFLSVGPSWGQAYSGQWTQGAVTSSIRTIALVAMAGAAVSFATTLANSNSTANQLSTSAGTLDAVLITGGIVIALAAGFDLFTAYGEAERANAKWERSVLGDEP